uniref:Uncharacterized protein n=1 Tax=Oryza meridionalis TaxID=40149 RepID=A0A0E0C069_9ORYZ
MGSEDTKDMLKNVNWKTVGGSVTTEPSQPVVKKRLPKKIRQVPECYVLPRRSLPSALAIYGAVCAAGVGAGMLLEVWINKKIKGNIRITVFQNEPFLFGIISSPWYKFIDCVDSGGYML